MVRPFLALVLLIGVAAQAQPETSPIVRDFIRAWDQVADYVAPLGPQIKLGPRCQTMCKRELETAFETM